MRTLSARAFLLVLVPVLALGACGGVAADRSSSNASAVATPARPSLLLATTTSTQDSGLLDALIPDFERRTGYRVRTTAVGSGAALALGARGDTDVILAHSPAAEKEFMAAGNGAERTLVMHNDFIIVGPPGDPARARGRSSLEAVRRIAASRTLFLSRGDQSGTDVLEKSLWRTAEITPAAPWYVEAATGMGQTLLIASEKGAYTVTDRGTFLARRGALALAVIVENDPPLINHYHVITMQPVRFPRVNAAGARAFAAYLVSPEGQRLIDSFGVDRFGQALFFGDAGKPEP